jgi:DNA-binding PadR family transcriptional regulator
MEQDQVIDNLIQELRRGVIVLAVLSQLQEEQYGYSVMKLLADRGLDVDQGTLYPLLRRLETQGLLESKWRLEDSRPRRYYIISQTGKDLLPRLREEWSKFVQLIDPLLSEETIGERKNENGTH